MKKIVLIIFLLGIISAGITPVVSAATPTPVPTPSITPTPTPSPTPTPAKKEINTGSLSPVVFWAIDDSGQFHIPKCSSTGVLWNLAK